jgi:hypothetical protein
MPTAGPVLRGPVLIRAAPAPPKTITADVVRAARAVRWLSVPVHRAYLRWPRTVLALMAFLVVLVPVRWMVRGPLVLAVLVLVVVRAVRDARPVDPVLAVFRSALCGPDRPRGPAEDQDRSRYALPGTKVWGPVRRHAWGWEVDGEAGGPAPSNDDLRKQVHRVAGAYRQPTDAFEVLDRAGNGGFTLRFTDPAWTAARNAERWTRMNRMYPLRAQVMDRYQGTAEIAVQIDTGEPGIWEVFTPGVGARHGIVAGDTRYGKSTGLETLATVMCRSGVVAPAFADLAGGVTFDTWQGKAIGFADNVRDVEALMAALDREFEDRIRIIKANGWRGVWRVSEEHPVIPLFVDEGPELKASARASGMLSRAVRQWAKAGMCVIFAAQSLTIESILGKDAGSVAKAQLMAGNLLAYYANQGLAGLPFDISDLPPVPGVSKLYGPRHHEAALVRLLYPEDLAEDLVIPPFTWRAEPVLHRPDPVPHPMRVVREKPETPAHALLRVLTELGESFSKVVIEVSGLPQATAYAAFARLVDEGRAVSPRRGVWAVKEEDV